MTMMNRLLARSLVRHAASGVTHRFSTRFSAVVMIQQPIRTFSSASVKLSDLLARELAEEQENEGMPPELAELSEQLKKDWKIVDDETNGTVKLYSGKTAINFHCQESLQPEVDELDNDDEEPSAPVRFTTTVSKAGKTLVMWCVSEGGIASLEGVAVTTGDADSIFANGIASSAYQGPEFTELEEDVQDAFNEFLQTDCGVTSDVAAFIAMYTDYKEQAQYFRWLKQTQSIIQK